MMTIRRVGGYDLVEELGSGQYGVVYKGIHHETGEIAAVKQVPKNKIRGSEQYLLQEINNMLNIRSEYVATFTRTPTQSKANIYIYLQYCDGGDLKEALKQYRILEEPLVTKFGLQIALGLKDMQQANIVHRDLKPANIILTTKDIMTSSVKIADLGLSKSIDQDVMAVTTCGSPYYMAPEVFRPGVTYAHEVDIWSLGALIYELIVGHVAFPCQSLDELFRLQAMGPSLEGQITMPMKQLLARMLSYDSRKRPDVEEVIAILTQMVPTS